MTKDAKDAKVDLEPVNDEYEAKMAGFEVDCQNGEGDAAACHHVGEFYYIVKKEFERAAKVYEKNCREKDYSTSCFNLGRYYLSGKSGTVRKEEGRALLDKACKGGHHPACFVLGINIYLEQQANGFQDKKAADDALGILDRACDQESADSCAFIGGVHIKDTNPNRCVSAAIPYFEKGCAMNEMKSCFNLAKIYYKGDGDVAPDVEKHKLFLAKAKVLGKQYGLNIKGPK